MKRLVFNYRLMRSFGNGIVKSVFKAIRMSVGASVHLLPHYWL